ncbi:MAG: DegT/DnrJ/EryC1/StrS family aminotransferase [Planctomycetaceae bacterium]
MIPRHRPPFGLTSLLKQKLLSPLSGSLTQLEQLCADSLAIRNAVWLPSARYGICRTIEHVLNDSADVYCPAFTCQVVHEAIRRSGRSLQLLDCRPDGFLMNVNSAPVDSADYGVVLSEVFGHRFQRELDSALIQNARLRIIDMAMAIPDRRDLRRLRDQDVAVISFGLGKSLYSGWGGMAFTHDDIVAGYLRRSRDRSMTRQQFARSFLQETALGIRTAAHQSAVYGMLRTLSQRRQASAARAGHQPATSRAPLTDDLSPEWWHRPTKLSLRLTAANIRRAAEFERRRCELAGIYSRELSRLDGSVLRLPATESHGLSHYSIRTSSLNRDSLRQHLWSAGIDTATLFPFPADCHPAWFPHTSRLCSEIINLPLSHQLTTSQVGQICEQIRAFPFATSVCKVAA